MKIAFFEIEELEKKFFKDNLKKHKLVFFDEPISDKNVDKIKGHDIVCVGLGSEVDCRIIRKFDKLKGIVTMSTGFNHIDLKTAKENKISVSNTPNYGEDSVAEHTFALILALAKNIVESVSRTKKGDFSLKNLRGFDLKNKTIGIVGLGRIGFNVGKIAKGFGMKIIACTRHRNAALSKKLGLKYVSFDNLLKNSDIITLHVPLVKETKHMINRKNIGKIKKGAFLINTSRGKIVDSGALILALDKKILAGVGLDVLEGEEDIAEEKELLTKKISEKKLFDIEKRVLLKHPNVVITPHNAFNTWGSMERGMQTTLKNINGIIKGQAVNLVG